MRRMISPTAATDCAASGAGAAANPIAGCHRPHVPHVASCCSSSSTGSSVLSTRRTVASGRSFANATQVAADWRLGVLHNDFARALNRLDAEVRAVPNLVVLSASGEDQLSWSSEELRRTTARPA